MARIDLFNNKGFMTAWAETGTDGTLFTYCRTGDAFAILPCRRNENGEIEVLLIKQGRPEKGSLEIIKVVGGYLLGQPLIETAKKVLLEKAGVTSQNEPVILYRKMIGFTVVEIPIASLIISGWEKEKEASTEVVVLTLNEAASLSVKHRVGDQCTFDMCLTLYYLEKEGKFPLAL